MPLIRFLRSLYLTQRFFAALGSVVVLFVVGLFYNIAFTMGKIALLAAGVLLVGDLVLLYGVRYGIRAWRDAPERLSNGDDNPIDVRIESIYPMPMRIEVVDEIPPEFQKRDFKYRTTIPPRKTTRVRYWLRPVRRGEYDFGDINAFVRSYLGLAARRFRHNNAQVLPVYPSYLQMRKYEIMAHSNRLMELGIKKQRRIGHTMEFEQIREYVKGDDIRTINWRATARQANTLMVNQYQDQRSQQVYNVIDMGRQMRMPFNHMTLLDYAINTSLVMANTSVIKHDKAGLMTFSYKMHTYLPASRRSTQMQQIMEQLYTQQTHFLETDYQVLLQQLRSQLNQRSLLLLYTNWENLQSMQRSLQYLRAIAKRHLLVVVIFKNTPLFQLTEDRPKDTEGIYIKAIAEKLIYEKQRIIQELQSHRIHTILTAPEDLTVNTLNTYLEFKSRGLI